MQHVNCKVFAANGASVRFADAIPVFHRWIQTHAVAGLLIDVADYSHVPAGPGVVLVGHEADYALDNTRNRVGMLYNRRAPVSTTPVETLREAYTAATGAAKLLSEAPEFAGQLKFDESEIEFSFNDRALHPNTDAGWAEVEPAITAFFAGLWGAGGYTLTRASDPRERLRVSARRK